MAIIVSLKDSLALLLYVKVHLHHAYAVALARRKEEEERVWERSEVEVMETSVHGPGLGTYVLAHQPKLRVCGLR